MAKKEEAPVKKTTTVTLQVGAAGMSIIERGNGLPFISDRTEKAVEWLKAKGYKVTDIELIGAKPANWDTVFEIAPAVPTVVDVAAAEATAAIIASEDARAIADLLSKAKEDPAGEVIVTHTPSAPEEQPTLIDPIADPADATAVVTEVISNETAPAN